MSKRVAGGMFRTKTLSTDHIEATFALNTVAAFALTRLHSALAQAQGRVVNITTSFLGRTRLKVAERFEKDAVQALYDLRRACAALTFVIHSCHD